MLSLNSWLTLDMISLPSKKYGSMPTTRKSGQSSNTVSHTQNSSTGGYSLLVFIYPLHTHSHPTSSLPRCGSGALGAGLAIFSRFPFVETSILPYALNGQPVDVAAGDWFVGKAAANVVILHPILGKTQIFNTHVRVHPPCLS